MCRLPSKYLGLLLLFLLFAGYSPPILAQDDRKETKMETLKVEDPEPASDTLAYNYLLYGPDAQDNINYELMVASSEGYLPGIEWLIKNGADVNASTIENSTPLIFAVAANKVDAVKLLLENNADPNIITVNMENPLIIAVRNQNPEIAEILVRDSANISFSDRFGATPLHYASIYGSLLITDMLLYYSAAIYIRTNDGTTPLMAAIWAGHADVADLLMQNGADPSEKDNNGFTPFLIAAQNGDTLIMDMLIKRMVNIYETNNYNYNALCLSIKGNHQEAVKYLLGKGDKWIQESARSTDPGLVATIYKRKEILELLKEHNFENAGKPGIDQVSVSASLKHCLYDYQAGFSVIAKEPVRNFGFIAGIDFKPFHTRVMVREEDDRFFQYKDKSALVYGGLYKEFPLTDNPLRSNWSLTGSLSAGYDFGNNFRGTSITPGHKLRINPAAGLKRTASGYSIILKIEFLQTDFHRVGPVWLRLGISSDIYFNDIRAPGKVIKWY